jgi:hypothetical protein
MALYQTYADCLQGAALTCADGGPPHAPACDGKGEEVVQCGLRVAGDAGI